MGSVSGKADRIEKSHGPQGGGLEFRVKMPRRFVSRCHVVTAFSLIALASVSCRQPQRMVKIAWDAATPPPTGYKILVDDRVVMDIPPPPLDPSCSCPTVSVPVPAGPHTIKVIAVNAYGQSAPSAIAVVK